MHGVREKSLKHNVHYSGQKIYSWVPGGYNQACKTLYNVKRLYASTNNTQNILGKCTFIIY